MKITKTFWLWRFYAWFDALPDTPRFFAFFFLLAVPITLVNFAANRLDSEMFWTAYMNLLLMGILTRAIWFMRDRSVS